jgi:hypothetical protein
MSFSTDRSYQRYFKRGTHAFITHVVCFLISQELLYYIGEILEPREDCSYSDKWNWLQTNRSTILRAKTDGSLVLSTVKDHWLSAKLDSMLQKRSYPSSNLKEEKDGENKYCNVVSMLSKNFAIRMSFHKITVGRYAAYDRYRPLYSNWDLCESRLDFPSTINLRISIDDDMWSAAWTVLSWMVLLLVW